MRSLPRESVRWLLVVCLSWLALGIFPALAAASSSQPRFAAEPAGVFTDNSVAPGTVPTDSDGLKWLLVSDQMLLTGPQPIWFRQVSYQVVEERGLEQGGQFNIHYQPAYQRVEIHAIEILRDGQRLDRRASSRVEVLRRESDLEAGLLDGRLTAHVTLPDLRAGDTVEYRYSVIGENPVFGRGYYDSYTASYGVVLGERRVDVVYPQTMPLRWRAPAGFQITQQTQGAYKRLQIRAHDVPAVIEYSDTPSSFDAYGLVELTSAADWAAISAWALPLYPRRFSDRAAVAPLVASLNLNPADPEGSALRATAFVQGEIRYTGLDMGLNSHAPNAPETVLERRFGDCKDKTTLLIALLAEAGVPADPVLVNTQARQSLAQRLPSARAFDHVIVRARLPTGEVWIDPTMAREQGQFADRRSLGYRLGLPIAAGSRELVPIPQLRPSEPQVDVSQHIALDRQEDHASAEFKVATRYGMGYADDVRRNFSANGAEKLGKDYLAYMQGYYEGMRASKAPSTREEGSGFHVDEQYGLRWDLAESGNEFGIVLFQVLDWLPKIGEQERHAPLALYGPRYGRQVVRTTSNNGWSIKAEHDKVANDYFRLEREVEVQGDELVITVTWRRDADEVPAKDVAALRKDVAKARELMEYSLNLDNDQPWISTDVRDWIWPLLTIPLAAVALVGLWAMRRRWVFAGMFYRPHATVSEQVQSAQGLGRLGLWLLLLSVAVDAWFDLADRARTWEGGWLVAGSIVIVLALALRCLAWAGMHKLAFLTTGVSVPFTRLLRSNGQALAPLLLMVALSVIALRFDLGVLNGSSSAAEMPGLLLMMLWFVVGILWSVLACIQASAALAGVRRWHAVGVLALATVGMIILLIPFVALYVLYKMSL